MGALSLAWEPHLDLNWQPSPHSLYFPCATCIKEHVYWSGSLGMGCWEFQKSILPSETGFMPPPPDCTCAVEHLLQGDSNMGFSWHPFCSFQKYKLACVGSRLGAALLSSLSFCSFIFHSSCQESLFFQKFLLYSPCHPLSFFFSLRDPTISFLEPFAVSYPRILLRCPFLSSVHFYLWCRNSWPAIKLFLK